MKHEYLHELLREHKTVIVPGLGAFVSNDSPVAPVIFNEYLKFNDGTVASFLAQKENLSLEEADKKLEVFVAGIISLLQSGRDVIWPGIGRLRRNEAEDKLEFVSDPTAGEASTQPLSAALTPPPAVTPPPPEPVSAAPEPPPVHPEKTAEPPKPVPAPEPAPFSEPAKVKPTSTEAPLRRKTRWKVWLALVLLVIAGGIGAYIMQEDLSRLLGLVATPTAKAEPAPAKTPEPDVVVLEEENLPTPIDTVGEEAPILEEELVPSASAEVLAKPKSAPEPTAKPHTQAETPKSTVSPAVSGEFYVVVGCYQETVNAERMVNRLNERGLNGMNLGTYGGLIYVAAYSASSLSEAESKAASLRNDFPQAWVFAKK